MPYKDKAKEHAVNMASAKKIYYPQISVRIRRDDGSFYDSLLDAAAMRAITPAEYLRIAAREKLERDGEMR